jgi:hypothetical protein
MIGDIVKANTIFVRNLKRRSLRRRIILKPILEIVVCGSANWIQQAQNGAQ